MEGITASRNYSPGNVIYSEPAFAKVVQRKYKDVLCEFCCRTSFDLRACKGCLAVKYCGKDCQKNDWCSHKLECKYLKFLPKGSSADFVRLLAKVILKIKDKDWKLITTNVLGEEFSFDDIDSHFMNKKRWHSTACRIVIQKCHQVCIPRKFLDALYVLKLWNSKVSHADILLSMYYKEMTENPRMALFFNEMKELTGKYIGFENLPDDDSLMKVLGKVRFSLFRTRVIAFFIGAMKFNPECIPNSNATLCGNGIKIWASKNIRKGEDKISVPGRMILLPFIRYEDDNSCKCEDCSLPYGESILFKIIDKKRAFSVIAETEQFLDAAEAFHNLLSLPESQQIVDRLLSEQEGVLGDTNYLRMGLIALRCLNIGGNTWQIKELLLKLERTMSSVFGEYYMEMLPIYKCLCVLNVQLGYPAATIEYVKKVLLMEQHMTIT